MPSLLTPGTEGESPVPSARHQTGLITIVFTDLVGSTALKQQVGDRTGATLIQQHHGLVRELLRGFQGGEEIETAGDSFLIVFSKPSDAAHFGLLLHARLRALNQGLAARLEDRIGIHVGEVVIREQYGSPNPKGLTGIQVDTCARVMGLAQGGQILLTRSAFDSARQMLTGEDVAGVGPLEWLNHGSYLLKGIDASLEVCEVGEVGIAPLQAPAGSEKAQRQVTPENEPVLGWRPAVGQLVPNTRWRLETKLGEGGFGEVWLGRHQHTKERRVFKFCFQADRVRFLKREMTLFRVLKERVGDHPNIVRLHDIMLDHPPFYVEMDYVDGADLRSWCEERGGVEAVPLETRLEIVAQAADGLQAAHEAGVIHRDIKPDNILIGNPKSEIRNLKLEVKLTDFGIGQVVSEEYLSGITRAGFTQTMMSDSSSSHTGTQLYMAPELLAGKPASTRSDIYSLGVVLYQLLVGDFSRPVTTDWAEHMADPLLREDLKRCFAGKPQDRFAGAGQLAENLRALPARRVALERQEAEKVGLERAAYRRGVVRVAGVATVIVVVIAGLAMIALRQSTRAKEQAAKAVQAAAAEKQQRVMADQERASAEGNLYAAKMNLAQQAWEQNNLGRLRQLLEDTRAFADRGFEWYYWQRQTHLDLRTLRGHLQGVSSVVFSPDGHRIVTGSFDQTAKIWDVASGRELLTLKGHRDSILSVDFSSDGQRIVTGSGDGTARVWEAASGRELLTLKGHRAIIYCVRFSPDGQRIVTGSLDSTAKVWEAASGRELRTLKGHSGAVVAAFSPDGQRIVTGSSDRTAKVWEAASGGELRTFKGHRGTILSVAFSPDGLRILTGSGDQTAKVWEAASGRELFTLKGAGPAAFSPDGQRIVTGSLDQTAKVWEAATGRELFALKGHSGWIWSVAFSADGQKVVTGSLDQTAKVWEAARGLSPDKTGRETLTLEGHSARIGSVAFSPDCQRIVTGSSDQTAKVWEAASVRELRTLKGHRGAVVAAFSSDGQRIVTGSSDQTAKVWEAASGREQLTLKGHTAPIWSVAFSPDGLRILTGSGDQTAKVWEAASGRELVILRGRRARVWSVAFSPDGQRVLTGSDDQTAKVWEASRGLPPEKTGKELFALKGHTAPIRSVAFSGDGQRIVTGSGDNTAKVWEAANGRQLLTLKGHSAPIRSVAFSPDCQRIVTGSDDQTAKVWEAASGRELLTLRGHTTNIYSVVFSPDGQKIVTASDDHTAKVWQTARPERVVAWQEEEERARQYLAVLRRENTAQQDPQRIALSRDEGAIKRWLILAPIALTNAQRGVDTVDTEQIEGEGRINPKAGEGIVTVSGELMWQEVTQDDYAIDFNEILGDVTPQSVAYAVCYIRSEAEQLGLRMLVGSDDESKVYLNGKQIYKYPAMRNFVADQDTVAVALSAGLNVLVFKVVNETLDWQGSIRFTDAQGNPVKGIKVTLAP
jgi:WD40 repeat protein/class 3 adenylate cyclase/tRNA A-37 threonylcarbamoyl transferase component Bud32